ncbi:hypothetical protein [Anaeromyxobacter paludicola]|uniref:Uncharacterized protein n=1 Tax=Anaeromyxobacter paludicola TaxID=2918171 RepID=A0ABN6NEC9_9BACT|nr:hypothetical protein [Anaeromyxobacter paludicola]BDG10861.1 hypothetical protein AMPC_39740 [Anaeromyxobacter paludicola]
MATMLVILGAVAAVGAAELAGRLREPKRARRPQLRVVWDADRDSDRAA